MDSWRQASHARRPGRGRRRVTFDDRLRAELEQLEDAAPAAAPPRAMPGRRVRWILAAGAAAAILVVGTAVGISLSRLVRIGDLPTNSASATTPSPIAPPAAQSEERSGDFVLTILATRSR